MIYSRQFLIKSTLLFPLWLLIGVAIYALYGYKQNRLVENKDTQNKAEQITKKLEV